MPKDDNRNDLSIYVHVQMVAMSLHFLKMKLRDVIKTSTEPDDMMCNVMRLVSKDLAESKSEIERNTLKLEKHFAKLKTVAVSGRNMKH
ncbi:MAG: hypothetical protein ACKOBC_11030 [Hyphomicrobiales bacterium]